MHTSPIKVVWGKTEVKNSPPDTWHEEGEGKCVFLPASVFRMFRFKPACFRVRSICSRQQSENIGGRAPDCPLDTLGKGGGGLFLR